MQLTKKSPPIAFISSTVKDLKSYRLAVRDAALRAGFFPVMQEYFTAEGDRPPLAECMKKLDQADLLVVIVAYRYGWIPEDQPGGLKKSITWLECERAWNNGKSVLAFLVEPQQAWPETAKEGYRLTEAAYANSLTPELAADVQEAIQNLEKFKHWLDEMVVRAAFTSSHDLATKVVQSLYQWRQAHAPGAEPIPSVSDPRPYLTWLQKECATIDIRGLQVGTGKAHKFGIEELYIPLTTTSAASEEGTRKASREMLERTRRIQLQQVLQHRKVTIIGDPGAGKTTFLRRIAFVLCQAWLNVEPDAAQTRLGLKAKPFPVFIRLGELADHIRRCRASHARSPAGNAPTWLVHFLAEKSQAHNWNLDEEFFLNKIKSGEVMFLLDGLDEAPDRRLRENLSDLVAEAMQAYSRCTFVITSRPQAYTGRAVLQDFQHFTIDPLEESSMNKFLLHWSQALFAADPEQASSHHQKLMIALKSRPEILRMARNPVMLTALAVVHWNERRLPEQRSDLYESIIRWLLRSREQRSGRLPADRCGQILQQLALAMQIDPKGRRVSIGRRKAAEMIQENFQAKVETDPLAAAERFLEEEEVDSGIVVARGNQLVFWHLTFQEYLAARALGGKIEKDQQKQLIRPEILHHAEWRESLLLFGGILYRQGMDKVDNFFSAILDTVKAGKELAVEARCVGLIGAMLRDLTPFKYELRDARYAQMRTRVMAIFDRSHAKNIPLEVRLQAADALGQAGDPRLHQDNPARWVTIPAGSFLMGAQKKNPNNPNYDADAYSDESPVHEVTLSEFQVGKYPVTVYEYRRFVDDGGYKEKEYWKAGGWGDFEAPDDWEQQIIYPNRPVVGVSWYEAMAYATWAGCRLPSEAQWERVARGKSEVYHKYPWGDQAPDGKITHSGHNSLDHPAAVGMFPEDCTEEGVLDMGGNVWEWCCDWKDVYSNKRSIFYEKSAGSVDPVNCKTGVLGKVGDLSSTVIRGGSWGNLNSDDFRCSYRLSYDPFYRYNYLGFRVVCSARL